MHWLRHSPRSICVYGLHALYSHGFHLTIEDICRYTLFIRYHNVMPSLTIDLLVDVVVGSLSRTAISGKITVKYVCGGTEHRSTIALDTAGEDTDWLNRSICYYQEWLLSAMN